MEKNGTTETKTKAGKQKKRALSESKDLDDACKRRPKRAAACTDFKEKSVRISEKSATVEIKKQQFVEDEIVALHLTSSLQTDEHRQTRRLTDFVLHDTDGAPQPVEMLEIGDLFIAGVILPSDCKDKEKGVRCESFGRVENWSISGYEDGSPVIWISTDLADYDCLKPATSYKKMYDYFFEKACASVAVYKKVSKSSGGNPDTSLDELLAAVVRSMSGSKSFSSGAAIQDFVISQGEFIYNQLAGLDETAKKHETSFAEIPVLVTLRDGSSKLDNAAQMVGKPSNGTLRIGGVSEVAESKALACDQLVDGVDEDRRYAKLLQDEEYRKSMQQPRRNSSSASASNKVYIKIDEDEIANDYPLPAYFKNSVDEADELLLYEPVYEVDQLPRRMLHNWALYNSDTRFISLELLPMKPCADIDINIYGSGVMTEDDGTWIDINDSDSSTQGSQQQDLGGMAIFLSEIKEWMIEFGAGMVSISFRTDVAWYRLGKPSKQYSLWYEPVLKTARVAISIITMLDEQSRISRLSFADVIKRLSEFQKNNKAYISSDSKAVERYVVVHGQIILQLFAEYPKKDIRRCPFIVGLASKLEDRHHTKWVIKKKKIVQKKENFNPRAGITDVVSKKKAMQATTTRLINRIWGEFYSNYAPEVPLQEIGVENGGEEIEEENEIEEEEGEIEEDDTENTFVEDEIVALHLTSSLQTDEHRQTRRLTDFVLHDTDGAPQPVEMLEIGDLFIAGVILPSDCKDKEKGVRCESFGRVENWSISGYEDGSPVIWISTDLADYDCLKPATSYKKMYDYFFEKACASVAVYKKVSKSSGGNPDTSLDELLAAVVRSMSGSKSFSSGAAIQDFVISQGEFIYNQLAGLDETAKKHETSFAEIPVLVTLRDGSSKLDNAAQMVGKPSNGTLRIGGVSEVAESKALACDQLVDGVDEDRRYAKLLQDEEYRKSMQQPRRNSSSASASNKVYIKIDEDEIANDYPLPAYFKNSVDEADELLLYEPVYEVDQLPRRMLHNWALYNSDTRFISLELLPMKPCADIDINIYGSGVMTEDDGTWIDINDSDSSTQGSQQQDLGGMAIFLSEIKEWMIEFGAGMVSISFRTDVAWYRLGKPSKQYSLWYEPVLKTARVAISIITMLDEQSRISRLSFADVIKRLSEFQKNNKAYISSDSKAVERYVVVHGQIILQLFAEYPKKDIRRCPFIVGLASKLEDRHHTKWVIKKKKIVQKKENFNPRAGITDVVSKKKAMQATTTRLINRIWGEFYSNYAPEVPLQEIGVENGGEEIEEENEIEEEEGEIEEDDTENTVSESVDVQKSHNPPKKIRGSSGKMEIRWDGEIIGKTSAGEPLYRQALVGGETVAVGGAVIVEVDDSDEIPAIYFVEYMFESSDHCKMLHGKLLQRGSETVLGNAANERELFLTNECMTVQLKDIKGTAIFEMRSRPWGHQYRKETATADKLDRTRADERKAKDLPTEYYCKSLYSPERGGFFSLPLSDIGRGSGFCNSCRLREDEEKRSEIKLNVTKTGFFSKGIEYSAEDYVYVKPDYMTVDGLKNGIGNFKSGRNIGLRAFVVCQLLEIIVPKDSRKADLGSFEVKVRRFYRPEDISADKAYTSDIQELYYSQDTDVLPPGALKGKCEVRKKNDMQLSREYPLSDNIFFCEHFYDSSKGSLKQLPANIKLKFSTIKDDMLLRKKKGKGLEIESDSSIVKPEEVPKELRLATLDIFAGCGGLSHGLEQAGVSATKWAIEYEEPAGQAFRQNHTESTVFVNNCNVILRAIMEKCGDEDDCIATTEAAELAAKLDENQKSTLPLPGQVDFINGGPPCQGFSGMNRFNYSPWSKVQCEMILAFLSFADYFRPRYFLLENVRTFVSHNKGQTFRLTLASLLEMGYQVRFGILEAGAYGVSQSRKRAFIWAAAPEEVLPEWPEPMHVFRVPKLKISLSQGLHYAAVRSTQKGAPFRSITVRDTIGDLPQVENGEARTNQEYKADPVSSFQKVIRGNMISLTDHICKAMNELNLIRCKNIPKRPGADWRDLPDEKVTLSNGKTEDLIPWCLPNTAKRHNQWKGLFGRLDWEGNFPTSITDPQPMGKVGMCFHPDQDRILTVRECARSQGFPDSYEFAGTIIHKHRQIGNAVPPSLAFALGRKLKEAVDLKRSLQHQP
ncbi:unnamed protein product [Arabis nemorensis]|uniref:Cytosine-specific methyltransferase n=1 Tax=Arabis nemorensis TaxID=586526 RepID=A0A565C0H4_9BRAS|nr:unnamed protein product [Arabis nemorensis]